MNLKAQVAISLFFALVFGWASTEKSKLFGNFSTLWKKKWNRDRQQKPNKSPKSIEDAQKERCEVVRKANQKN
jgi:hypothetical protein